MEFVSALGVGSSYHVSEEAELMGSILRRAIHERIRSAKFFIEIQHRLWTAHTISYSDEEIFQREEKNFVMEEREGLQIKTASVLPIVHVIWGRSPTSSDHR